MSTSRHVFLFIVCGCFPLGKQAAEPAESAMPSALDPAQIVEELPWAFSVSTETTAEPDVSASEVGAVHHRFTSTEPYKQTAHGKLFLQADLTATGYTSPEAAEAAYEQLLAKADSDIGLSYAWDRVIRASGTLFHLHAGCTFSEASFEQMASRLDSLVRPLADGTASGFSCRCGGGCRAD